MSIDQAAEVVALALSLVGWGALWRRRHEAGRCRRFADPNYARAVYAEAARLARGV